MIAWLAAAVRTALLEPQGGAGIHADYRTTLVPMVNPPQFDIEPAQSAADIRLVSATSAPLRSEIGGGRISVRHTLTVSLAVTDGDALRGEERRDRIMLDVIERMYADPTLGGTEGPRGQSLEMPMGWRIDYSPLGSGLPSAYAALELTADVDLNMAR